MPDVMIVPTQGYGPHDLFTSWAFQYDMLDGYQSRTFGGMGGSRATSADIRRQQAMMIRIGLPRGDRRENETYHRAVLEETFLAYERAAVWAERSGRLILLAGHGLHSPGRVYASLAPNQYCFVQASDFEKVFQARRGEVPASTLNLEQRFIDRLGKFLSSRRLDRIDFLSCSVGVGPEGRRFVQHAATMFGHTVRALRGELEIRLRGNGFTPYSVVARPGEPCPPSRRPSRDAFCREYASGIPDDPTLWTTATPEL